jgi:ribosome maturation factor RimP
MRATRSELRHLLEPGVNALGFDLVDVELTGSGRHGTLRVYIDAPGGVNVEDCADVSEQLSALLDVEDPLSGSYILEVSSPGFDRPLVTREDFERFAGETVRIRMQQPIEGRRNFTGRVLRVEDKQLMLELDPVSGGEQERISLSIEAIERARLVPKY